MRNDSRGRKIARDHYDGKNQNGERRRPAAKRKSSQIQVNPTPDRELFCEKCLTSKCWAWLVLFTATAQHSSCIHESHTRPGSSPANRLHETGVGGRGCPGRSRGMVCFGA